MCIATVFVPKVESGEWADVPKVDLGPCGHPTLFARLYLCDLPIPYLKKIIVQYLNITIMDRSVIICPPVHLLTINVQYM